MRNLSGNGTFFSTISLNPVVGLNPYPWWTLDKERWAIFLFPNKDCLVGPECHLWRSPMWLILVRDWNKKSRCAHQKEVLMLLLGGKHVYCTCFPMTIIHLWEVGVYYMSCSHVLFYYHAPLDPGCCNRVCFHNPKSFFNSEFCMRYPVSYVEMKKRIQSAMLFWGCVYIIHEFRIRFNSLYVLYSLTCPNPSSFIRVLILEQNTGHNAKKHSIRVRNLSGRGTIFSTILLNPVVGLNPYPWWTLHYRKSGWFFYFLIKIACLAQGVICGGMPCG